MDHEPLSNPKPAKSRRIVRGLTALSLGLLAMIAGVPLGAYAAVGIYRYPGHMCRLYKTQSEDASLDPGGLGANGIKNVHPETRYVACPLVLYQNTASENWIGQAVFLLSAPSGVSPTSGSCKIYRRTTDGTSSTFFTANGTLSPPGSKGFYWGALGSHIDCTNAQCSFYCGIPSGVVIEGYQYTPGHYG